MEIFCCVMAAGKGVRFLLDNHKLLTPLSGKTTLHRVLDRLEALGLNVSTVLNQAQPTETQQVVESRKTPIIWQPEQNGTGGALQSCFEAAQNKDTPVSHLLILNADMPCIDTPVLEEIIQAFKKQPDCFHMVTTTFPFTTNFGRVFQKGNAIQIKEAAECTSDDLKNGVLNVGIYWFPMHKLETVIDKLPSHQPKGEKYITDLFSEHWANEADVSTNMVHRTHWQYFVGMNDTSDLLRAENILQEQILAKCLQQGVHFKGKPAYIDESVQIGRNTVVYPNVTLLGNTHIGEACTIEPGVVLKNATIGDHSQIFSGSYIEDSQVGSTCRIGPYTRLRANTTVGNECRIGNFVEMKKTTFGDGSKSAHLAYVGDSTVGKKVNISCGVITCNYDGASKHQTVIEDGTFIGSDVQLIAPIRIGKDCYIASGSTITDDLKADDFAIARCRQTTKPGLAKKLRPKKK